MFFKRQPQATRVYKCNGPTATPATLGGLLETVNRQLGEGVFPIVMANVNQGVTTVLCKGVSFVAILPRG